MKDTVLKKCKSEDIQRVIEYIGDDRLLCFYLYMDILECGVEDEGLGLWVSELNGKIKAAMYQYYDCLHLFSRENCPVKDVMTVIETIDPKVIISSEVNIRLLMIELGNDSYTFELNHIITTDKMIKENKNVEVLDATESDIPEIVRMMMKDKIYSSIYSYEKLCTDLSKRLRAGFGRLFIIRDENKRLVCADATNAETEYLAVIGGLVTDPEMRGRGLGAAMTAAVWNRIKNEGKRGLAFLLDDNEKTINLHKKLGYDFIGYSARLIKK